MVQRVTVGSTRVCRTILRSSLSVVFLVAPDPVFRAWVPSRVHCSQQFLTAHSERSTWPATRRVDQPAVFIPMIRPLSQTRLIGRIPTLLWTFPDTFVVVVRAQLEMGLVTKETLGPHSVQFHGDRSGHHCNRA
ncbi:uncharacterized protein TNCV_4861341 [Trichonephila clavipes]|nr:uncharacterized protein TNCV_4861341 [Trichonephila clavipes]